MGRAWSFSSFHRRGNGIVSFWAAASLVPRGEWAFRQRKCALPACQACGLDAPRVLAELRRPAKHERFTTAKRAFSVSKRRTIWWPMLQLRVPPKQKRTFCVPGVWRRCGACPCRAPELVHCFLGALRARACGRFQMGRTRTCGEFRKPVRAPVGSSERQRACLWEMPNGTARVGGRIRRTGRVPV